MVIPQKDKEGKVEYIFTQGNIVRITVYTQNTLTKSILVYFIDGKVGIYEGKLAEQLVELCSNSTKEFYSKLKEIF